MISFSIATNREFKLADGSKKEETHWHRCTLWGKRAEAVANTLAQAQSAGKIPDVSKYTAAAGISAEELGKLVEKATAIAGSRF